MTPAGFLARSVGAGFAAGVGLAAYAVWESRAFTLRCADDAGPARRRPAAAGAAPQRHPHDAEPVAQAGVGAGRWPTSSPTWSSTPATTWPTSTRCRRCSTRSGHCSTCPASSCSAPTTTSHRSLRNPAALPPARRRLAQHPRRQAAVAGAARTPSRDAGWLDLTNRRGAVDGRRRSRSPSPASTTPTWTTTTWSPSAGRPTADGRPAGRRRTRAVPAGARPVRRRRLRRDLRRSHPRRSGVPAARRVRWSPTATSNRLAPRACTGTPPTRARATRGRRGCTSRPGSGPRRTRRSGSPADPRRPC